MTKRSEKIIYWTPRIICYLFIIFISLFAFDAISPDKSLESNITGFAIKFIPTLVLIIILTLSVEIEIAGGLTFILLGFFYIFYFNTEFIWTYVIMSGIPMIIGMLFIISYFFGKRK